MDDTPKTPHQPLEDWLAALRYTRLDGTLYWVTNEEGLVVDATPDIADAAGVPISSYIGSNASDIAYQLVEPTLEEREKRRERLFKEGGSDTITTWGDLPGLGWTRAIVTSTRITHPDTGRHYLISSAHDVTDLDSQLDYLRAPAFQGLVMLIIESNGTVLAATDAAATFCNPTLKRGDELKEKTIEDTAFASLKEREAAEVARSRESGEPAQAIEWLVNAQGDYRPYAVSRISFPKGRWMIVMMPVPTDLTPYMQLDQPEHLKQLLKAKNLRVPPTDRKLSKGNFNALVDIMHRLEVKEIAERDDVSISAVEKARERLAVKLGVASVSDIYDAVQHTDMGYLAQLYSQHVAQ